MERSEFHDNFVAFIMTHGRANNVMTYRTARKAGYTGRIVLVLDNEDKQADQYFAKYGRENCYVFDKQKYVESTDNIMRGNRGVIVYARNACFDIARELGYKYFIELDDDYYEFSYKFDNERHYRQRFIKDLDYVWMRMLDYYIACPFTTLAMAQCGDFIGGKLSKMASAIMTKRKAMNSFICSTDRPFKFIGRINEDVNTYTLLGTQGKIFLTMSQIVLNQVTTQAASGGMSEAYLGEGTYQKSFSSVIVCPSGVTVAMMGYRNMRMHHNVSWKNVAPMIIEERWKKK